MQAESAEGNRPRARQRRSKPPPAIAVPDIDEDAAERKRVLNVLAQRRYRQRKRQARHASSKDVADDTSGGDHPGASEGPNKEGVSDDGRDGVNTISPGPDVLAPSANDGPARELGETPADMDVTFGWAANEMDFPPLAFSAPGDELILHTSPDTFELPFVSIEANDTVSPLAPSGTGADDSPLRSSQPSSVTVELSGGGRSESFPDSYLLPVTELTLLRGLLRIATRINALCLWKPDALSPFNLGMGPPTDQLPATWQPTATQILLPHHPLYDLLPWPSCRDRIINVMNMPESERPPVAQDPLALMHFVYDMEDGAEGIRIWGDDPYDEKNWEVGQEVFGKWWFVFDRAIVERSNYWRGLRGAPRLCMTPSTTVETFLSEGDFGQDAFTSRIKRDKASYSVAIRNTRLDKLGTLHLLVRCDLGPGDDEQAKGREEITLEVDTTDEDVAALFSAIKVARDVQTDPTFEEYASAIQGWAQRCHDNHLGCRSSSTTENPKPLPKRVLDLADDKIVLVETEPGDNGLYVALSHSWGIGPAFVTNRENIAERKQSIDI
ncbi:hypothetical protein OQA88_1122 [Cercophora sp. LCS_1]